MARAGDVLGRKLVFAYLPLTSGRCELPLRSGNGHHEFVSNSLFWRTTSFQQLPIGLHVIYCVLAFVLLTRYRSRVPTSQCMRGAE